MPTLCNDGCGGGSTMAVMTATAAAQMSVYCVGGLAREGKTAMFSRQLTGSYTRPQGTLGAELKVRVMRRRTWSTAYMIAHCMVALD